MRFFALVLIMIVLAHPSMAQAAAQDEGGEGAAASDETSADAATAGEVSAAPERFFAVIGARVHTVSGAVLEGVTILCRDGSIVEIGPGIAVPEGAETLDASGFELYPGLIATDTRGIVGSGNPDDSTDVFSLNMTLALAAGITTAVSGNQAVKVTYGSVEDMVISRRLLESFSYSSRQPNQRRQVRQQLDRVREYLRELDRYEREKERNPESTEPDKSWIRGNYERYLRLMRGEASAVIDAGSARDLIEIARLSEDYGIRFVIRGAYEGWTVAPRLARANVAAIVTPRTRVDPDVERMARNGSSIQNAAILHDHGIRVAILPGGSLFGGGAGISLGGLAGRDLQHLPMEAAFAVRGGMKNDDAIRALTLDAARILGIDHRVGSIEVGKDADFIITDGDLLHYMTHVRWTIVNGRIVYDKDKEPLFQHIRTDGDPEAPPPDDYWPRRFNIPWADGSES